MRYSKFIVVLVILLNTLFTAAVLYIYYKIGSEPAIIIGSWFAFTTGELWMLANIKKTEMRRYKNENKLETKADES